MEDVAVLKIGLDENEFSQRLDKVQAKFDRFAQHVEERWERMTRAALGGRNGGSATARVDAEATRLAQVQAREQAGEARHQQRLTELRERAALHQQTLEANTQARIQSVRERSLAQQTAIEARRESQLDTIRAREQAAESRHQQRLTEYRERAAARSKAIASEVTSTLTRLVGVAVGVVGGQSIFERVIANDRAEKALAIFEGGVDKAKQRLQELRRFADNTPGLTRSGVIQSFQQLRADDRLTDRTRLRTIEATGRLGSVFDIENADAFTRNLGQIFNQGFERADIKEALGRVPIFEQLLQQAFGTKDAAKLKELKEAGKLTVETYFSGLADAINNDPRFSQIRESIGTRFDKLKDRVLDSLAPIGERVVSQLEPGLQEADELLAQLGERFQSLSPQAQNAALGIGAVTGALVLLGPEVAALSGIAIAEIIAVKQAYDENLGGLRDSVRGFVSEAREFWRNYGQAISVNTKEVWQFIKETVGATLSGIVDTARGFLALLNGNWETGLRSLLSGAEKLSGLFLSTFQRIGQQVIDGLIQGIIKGSERVRATVVAIAQGAKDSAKLVLGIQSPSREFFKIGEQTIDGFILGARSKAQQSAAEIRQITKAIIAASAPPDLLAPIQAQRERARDVSQFLDVLGPAGSRQTGLFAALTTPTPKVVQDALNAAKEIPTPPLALELREATGFAKGFENQIHSLDSVFERFGSNVSRSLFNVKDLFGSLKQDAKQLFFDIIGTGLQNAVRGLFGLFSSNRGSAGGTGGGIGGFFGGLLNTITGRNTTTSASAGGIGPGGTPYFNPNGGGSGGGLLNLVTGAAGRLFNTSGSGSTGILSQLFNLQADTSTLPSLTATLGGVGQVKGAASRGASAAVNAALGGGSLFSNLFRGIGFNLPAGASRGALASALPLLGVTLGAGLGGQSTLGNIIGGVGGGLLGIGLTAAPAGLAGGSFGFLAPLFSNPITAAIGGVALLGAFFLGRQKARRRDEQTSGESLQRAIDAIKDMRLQAARGQLTSVGEAEAEFKQIHQQFIQETLQIKTASVRKSRLEHQGDITPPLHPDSLRALFERETLPAIVAANRRRSTFKNQLPEFDSGGYHRGVGFALLHDREVIMNLRQQRELVNLTRPDIFRLVGVPNAPVFNAHPSTRTGVPAFDTGGVFYAPRDTSTTNSGGDLQPIVISVERLTLNVSKDEAGSLVAEGLRTSDGRKVLIRTTKDAVRNGEL